MTIHKEGFKIITVTLIVLLVVNALSFQFLPPLAVVFIGILSVLFFFVILQFFRSPKRLTDDGNEETIISPADGKVVVVEEVFETEFLNKKMIQISIFMSPFNVHLNRYPITGKTIYYKYHPGSYLVAWHPKSSTENERNTTVIEHENGHQILVRQIAGALAKRIVSYVRVNEKNKKGSEMGFIKFGSRVDVFIETSCSVKVQINDTVKGGETVLAVFN
ncbi:MAG: phosphatidylserine decarboxylase family protein [Bacteroidales bacterium]|nr:phosphatidylserine decarboxylase family protein [Bacteroidales bacterium]